MSVGCVKRLIYSLEATLATWVDDYQPKNTLSSDQLSISNEQIFIVTKTHLLTVIPATNRRHNSYLLAYHLTKMRYV